MAEYWITFGEKTPLPKIVVSRLEQNTGLEINYEERSPQKGKYPFNLDIEITTPFPGVISSPLFEEKVAYEYMDQQINIYLVVARKTAYLFEAVAYTLLELGGEFHESFCALNLPTWAGMKWEDAKNTTDIVYNLKK